MDAKSVDKQIAQMVDFITQEAKEKATEIMNKAHEVCVQKFFFFGALFHFLLYCKGIQH